MNRNEEISRLIKSLPNDYFASKESIAFYKRYDACDDFLLSKKLINKIWEWFEEEISNYSIIGNRDIAGSVSVLHTNSGAGKMLERAPKNSTITSYNLDYVCKRISEFVCQERDEEGNFYSEMKDISNFFAIKNTNSSRKYTIVITQPSSKMKYYKGIDCVDGMDSKEPLDYYTTRALHFVDEDGYLVVVFEPSQKEEMKRIVGGLGVVIEKEIEVPEKKYTSYEAMILRKK
tara:strand:- start:10320 stop:11015 length:696 start_codon:yes stop_codon:yes gene_type:complete